MKLDLTGDDGEAMAEVMDIIAEALQASGKFQRGAQGVSMTRDGYIFELLIAPVDGPPPPTHEIFGEWRQ